MSKSGAPDRWAPRVVIEVSTLTHVADRESGKFLVDRDQRAMVAIALPAAAAASKSWLTTAVTGSGAVLSRRCTRYAEIFAVEIDSKSRFELIEPTMDEPFSRSPGWPPSPPERTCTILSGSTPALAPSTSASLDGRVIDGDARPGCRP